MRSLPGLRRPGASTNSLRTTGLRPLVLALALAAAPTPAGAVELLRGDSVRCGGQRLVTVGILGAGEIAFLTFIPKGKQVGRLVLRLEEYVQLNDQQLAQEICDDLALSDPLPARAVAERAAAAGAAASSAIPDMTFITAGTTPTDVALGFIDTDTIPDLVVANRGSNDVSVALGLADGSLAAPITVPTGAGPTRVLVGDLDGINGGDIVTLNDFDSNLSVILRNAGGGFDPPVALSPVALPFDAAIGLLDDDAVLDLVVADANAGELVVLIGNGDGSFGAPTAFPGSGSAVVIADVNTDGEEDLVTNGDVLLGDGLGGFGAALSFDAGFNPTQVRVVDLGNDDNPDVVTVSTFSNIVSAQLGAGDGSFGPPLHYVVGGAPVRADALFVDPPGILVSHDGDDHVTILASNGDGSLDGARAHPVVPDLTDRQGALDIAVADFDGDGPLDIVAASGGTAFNGEPDNALLEGLGGGEFASFAAIPSPDGSRVIAGLWNAGSDLDLAFTVTGSPGIRSSRLEIALGNGDLTFTPGVALDLPDDDRTPDPIASGFVDAGTTADLLVANSGTGDVSVLLGDGLGGFGAQPTVPIGTAPNDLVTGLFDDDGDLDMVVSYAGQLGLSNGGVAIALGNGDGTFQAATAVSTGREPDSLATGDWNDDGDLDLAVAVETQPFVARVEVRLGDGLGGFGAPTQIDLGDVSLAGIGASDLNGDGDTDLFVRAGGSRVVQLFGDGTGAFEERGFVSGGGGRAKHIDVDGDGFPDLISATSLGYVSVRRGENDEDGDGVGDSGDNCTLQANPEQENTDADGSGNLCDGDFNQDLFVGGPDFDTFLGCFNQAVGPGVGPAEDPTCEESDMNADGFVGGPDFDLFLQVFNGPPGPSAGACGLGFELLLPLALLLAVRRRASSAIRGTSAAGRRASWPR